MSNEGLNLHDRHLLEIFVCGFVFVDSI